MIRNSWVENFEGLSGLSPEIRTILETQSRIVRLPAGTEIFGPDKTPDNLLLLLSGTVRVQQTAESGREIVLYRVDAGQSCVLTTACLLAQEAYTAEGIAESDIEAVAIPRGVFDDLLSRSSDFRTFVFNAYAQRITDLFRVIDDVAFGRIDVRLAERLLSLCGEGNEVHSTHQNLATELGTAREVVSRQLNEFQRRNWVSQRRGAIGIVDRDALAALANN